LKAVRLHGPGDIRFEEVEPPGPPGPAEVLVSPTWAGICGTDVKEYVGQGGTVPDQPHPLTGAHKPQILGHEFAAVVEATGEGVTEVGVGDRVVVMPLHSCGVCHQCRSGEYILCPNKAWVGLSTGWGGFGDQALVRSYQVDRLTDMSDEQGALVEPAAVSLNAVLRAGVNPGAYVLVVGAGPIGCFAIQASLLSGASRVFVSDPNPRRSAIAERIGATALSGPPQDQVEALLDQTQGRGVDRAIDCAGKDGTLALCVMALTPGGAVSVPSVHKGESTVDLRSLTRKPVSIIGSLGYTRDAWHRTIDLIEKGRYPVEQIVTSRIGRDAIIADGFEALSDGERGELKVLVDVGA
jgi:(R,R)-butanediol dehydrogenase/meso-butanediol dehydrogenase/diacetyl reductase